MEIEIHTSSGTWTTHVDGAEFADPGAAAESVRDRINAGAPIEVQAQRSGDQPHAYRASHLAVFNPGQVVAVIARERTRRMW